MRKVPRHVFVAPEHVAIAYEDSALPIEEGQTISQPYIVALMVEALELGPSDRVLEIGTGSGYAAAVLGEIARDVISVERRVGLARQATARLAELGYLNVAVRHGDGTIGWPEQAPYDGIVVAAGGPDIPPRLLEQLADEGRLVLPIGPTPDHQVLLRLRRNGERIEREELSAVQFVPLISDRASD
jgi:protein-L-isoaspartate(D-aspartate) O-methyltransferase